MASHDLTFGVFVPQGWKMELASIEDPQAKWAKAVEVAKLAEELGFDSLWVYDHFHNVPVPGARDDVRVLDDAGGDQPGARRGSSSARWSAARRTGTRACWRRSPRTSTSSPAAASSGASAPAGTSTSSPATATSSRRRRTASGCCARPSRS